MNFSNWDGYVWRVSNWDSEHCQRCGKSYKYVWRVSKNNFILLGL